MKQMMHWPILGLALVGCLGVGSRAWAQNNAAAIAAQEDSEERYRRLTAQMAAIRETQELHQQQMAALEKSVRELGDQVARANNNAATQERFNQLAEQIRKVDETRVTENKKIFDTIDELRRILQAMANTPPPKPPPQPPPATKSKTTPPAPAGNEEAYEYTVQKNDTLSGIVLQYRKENIKVTAPAIKEANPTVNWDRLRVGQKIYVPKPKS